MYMASGMDTGDIITQREIPILDEDTASTLHDKLSILGRDLLLDTLPSIIDGTNTRTKQDESLATYGFNIKREDEKINYEKTAKQVYNQIRGLNSWPGAYTIYEGKILKVWEARMSNEYPSGMNGEITNIYSDGFGVKTANGEIIYTVVQPEGKGKMKASDFINGEKNKGEVIGKVLG